MTNKQSSKILVIDDEVTERMLVKEYLEEAGFLVRLSEDGRHGLRMATTTSPDLIIVDAMLPSIDGYSICTSLRHDPRTAEVPIILITASKEIDAITRGLAAGATDFVTKPVEWRFLANRVTHVLNRSRSIKELQAAHRRMEDQVRASQTREENEDQRGAGDSDAETSLKAQIQSIQAEAAEQIRKAHAAADLKAQEASAAEERIRVIQAEAAEHLRKVHAATDLRVQEATAATEERIRVLQVETAEKTRKAQAAADLKAQETSAAADQKIRSVEAEAAERLREAHAAADRRVAEASAAAEERIRALQAEAAEQVRQANAAAEVRVRRAMAAVEEGIGAIQTEADDRVRRANEAAEAMLEAAAIAHAHETDQLKEASAAELQAAMGAISNRARSFWSFFSAFSGEQLNLAHSILENLEFAIASLDAAAYPGEPVEKLRRAGRHAKDLAGLTNNARTLVQHMTGGVSLREAHFDLGTLVDSTVQAVAASCRGRRLAIASRRPDGPLTIYGDEVRIKYCLLHLLANAIAFSVSGGTILLEAEPDNDGGVRVSVKDNGMGIPPAVLDKLRIVLEEPANMITHKDGGVGFGVPIASIIAGLHGGRLEFASGLGEGTTASLILPPERVCEPASADLRTA
jgi:DNA-binding response OmpR family regulator